MLLQTKLIFDYTVPIWSVVIGLVTWLGALVWFWIDLYFWKKTVNQKMKSMELHVAQQEEKTEAYNKELREDIDERFVVMAKDQFENKALLIQLNTKMDLILTNKIKFNNE